MNTAGSFLESNKINSGLECLKIIASLFGHRLDVHKIRRENCIQENRSCSDDLLRIARAEGFRAKFIKADSTKLKACPLPAVGETKDGQFFVLARINDRSALILRPEPGGRPEQVSLDDLALMSSGRLLLMTRREHVPEGLQVFGIRWFLPIIQRFRALLLEVVFISFTLGMIGLITPILFQVVIDKVFGAQDNNHAPGDHHRPCGRERVGSLPDLAAHICVFSFNEQDRRAPRREAFQALDLSSDRLL